MKIFVTKWVLARGILAVDGSTPYLNRGSFKKRTDVVLPGRRNGYPLLVGSEAFLTLEEAEEDAKVRFERHLKKTRSEYAYAKKAAQLIKNGTRPAVHKNIRAVNRCHAFP
jgi:hypothetical protein